MIYVNTLEKISSLKWLRSGKKEVVEKVKKDFEFLKDEVLGVLIFGSSINGIGKRHRHMY